MLSFRQYRHSISMAYGQFGFDYGDVVQTIPAFEEIAGQSAVSILEICVPGAVKRLKLVSGSLADQIISPTVRTLKVDGVEILIPLVNQQGTEWYGRSSPADFDFVFERKAGLLDNAQVIYDLGGHHGVWAAYYAKSIDTAKTVLSFEPSILNVEISALLMLINDISIVSTQAAAVGAVDAQTTSNHRDDMLIDFVEGAFQVRDFKLSAGFRADFMKIDIEGYEFDLLTNYDWIFDMAKNIHLELHIPHLLARKLDYRQVMRKIPFDRISVSLIQHGQLVPVTEETELDGFCSLMLKSRF